MKRFLFIVFWPCLLWAVPDQKFEVEKPRERVVAPPFRVADLSGRTFDSDDVRGKVILINFWATYCLPCRAEMPSLVLLQKRFPNELAVVTLAVDATNRRGIERFVEKYKVSLPVLLDVSKKVRTDYSVRMLPTTYIVAPDGKIFGRVIGGADWNGPRAHALVRTLARKR